MLYLNHRESNVKVLGPGNRYVLWVQGCKKNCPGCLYPEGRIIGTNGYWISETEILKEIVAKTPLTGITVSGGEPFLQQKGLADLVRLIREKTQLDIMVYSGYTLEELRNFNDSDIDYILDNIDILVDGEYVEALNTNHIYRGSDNQKIHFLSDKYLQFKDKIENAHNRSLEFVLRDDELFIVGIPEKGFAAKFRKKIIEYSKIIKEEGKNER